MNGRVVLGVTGSIAAYKAVELARLLKKSGADVQVILTKGAHRFITPLTFEAITGRPARSSVWTLSGNQNRVIDHVEDAYAADRVIVAPASANFLARYAHGFADDALTATLLSTVAPVAVAPAMETHMWRHPATRSNVALLRDRGVQILGPAAGDLASGRAGEGRMWDPERIAQTVLTPSDLSGLTMLVTAGPTWEPIDPVRVLTNRSTGAMGIAIAEAAARRGAHVRLVLGPTHLSVASSVDVTRVETANEMLKASKDKLSGVDVLVATAAVSDFRPSQPNASKLKRAESSASTLELVENPDILATLSPVLRAARPQATVVGFAAETEDVITHARGKMLRKGCDFVVGNLVGPGQGFGAGQTKVIAVRATDTTAFGPASKPDVAEFILDQVIEVRRQQVGS